MDLVFLHGAPASGKLTTAKALQDLTGARLFDNHAVLNAVRTILDFDEPGFWPLVHQLRMSILKATAQANVRLVLTTACYIHPHDLALFEDYEALAQSTDGAIYPVFLDCPFDTLLERVGNSDRRAHQKIGSPTGLKKFMDGRDITAVPRDTCLRLDSALHSAQDNAARIAAHFDLG